MEYWREVLKIPTGVRATDYFAKSIDAIPKVVFSKTLTEIDWSSAQLAKNELRDEVMALRQDGERDMLVGSRSLIVSLLNLNLVDELQLCFHPLIAHNGLALFEDISKKISLTLIKTKTFSCGAVIMYYQL